MRAAATVLLCLVTAVPAIAEDAVRSPLPRPNPVLQTVPAAPPATAPTEGETLALPAIPPAPMPSGQTALAGVLPPAPPAPGDDAGALPPLRPRPNPWLAGGGIGAAGPAAPAEAAVRVAVVRPRPRPAGLERQVAALRAAAAAPAGPQGGLDLLGLRPKARGEVVVPVSAAAAPAPDRRKRKAKEAEPAKGSVCGVPAIRGERIAPIKAKVQGCGLADGVRVTAVAGARLSQAITVDCATAKALNTWVAGVVQPAFHGEVVELRIAAHYICRPRNNKRGAKVSEHGRGKAVDVAALVLSSGKVVSVAGDYRQLRAVHRQACGIFGTTLGPGSDGYHEDHLHLDTAAYRSGPYCR